MLRMLAATFVIIVLSFSAFPLSTAVAGQSAIERVLESEKTFTKSDKVSDRETFFFYLTSFEPEALRAEWPTTHYCF